MEPLNDGQGQADSNEPDSPEAVHLAERDPHYGLPPILTVHEAARFLRVNVKTIYDAIAARRFPARRLGRRAVILREALIDWLTTTGRVPPSPRR